jgi:hypothetical protein
LPPHNQEIYAEIFVLVLTFAAAPFIKHPALERDFFPDKIFEIFYCDGHDAGILANRPSRSEATSLSC